MMPNVVEYDLAVTDLSNSVLSPRFRGGSPRPGGSTLLVEAYPGQWSIVYPIDVNNELAALRCWLRDPADAKARYTGLREFLRKSPHSAQLDSYFVDFEYIDRGIRVRNQVWPILYMDWVNGKRLNEFLDEHYADRHLVQGLAADFENLITTLHTAKVSHGDLQDGNILVAEGNPSYALKLVDYDAVYAPPLTSVPRRLVGLENYQPHRGSRSNIDPLKVDYFSELVIYLSLRVLVEAPELWVIGREQQLLFTQEDFKDPGKSEIFERIRALSPSAQFLGGKLAQFCRERDLNRLVPLESILAEERVSNRGRITLVEQYFAGTVPTKQIHLSPRSVRDPLTPASLETFFKTESQPASTPKAGPTQSKPTSAPSSKTTTSRSSETPGWVWAILILAALAALFFLLGPHLSDLIG